MICPACGKEAIQRSRFCPSCGAPLTISATPTRSVADSPATPSSGGGAARQKTPTSPGRTTSSGSVTDARFVPGTQLAERYRIVALIGKGGMGEVYRAEDLKLEQTVALKFLPQTLAADGATLARFHREVRVARQVSHPNVCRVFDIGEADGQVFLSMEYVDGEDLSSLLRRIGRLPSDKATEIARQLCAGLAAAHEYGVLHRDLKPSNVMIDGRGKARITDFGLAGLADEFRADELRAGTPAYMAPEQLEGREITVRSDIYALGLVLYEVFTGKRAFEAPTIVEMKYLQEQSTPTSPSALIKDLDPLVERVILRCLEKDPRKRPASALQVAAALPGGDPLAAALAAGETPSPEMVAASGETEGQRPAIAWACLAASLVFLLGCVVLAGKTKLYRLVPMEKTPDALAEKARDILQSIGHTEAPADSAASFAENFEFLPYIRDHDKSPTRWQNLERGALEFWYRSGPRPLEPVLFFPTPGGMAGAVTLQDPPLDQSGMTLVKLTPRGKLTHLVVVPPQVEEPATAVSPPPDWAPLFAAAGLDPAKWTPTAPRWTPPVHNDARAAWTGELAERLGMAMRIEAAAYRGKPVYFELIGPWTRPERMQPYKPTRGERVAQVLGTVLLLAFVVGGLLLARRNLRMGRGDRKGAARLGSVALVAMAVSWAFGVDHVPNFYEIGLFVMGLSGALFFTGFLWVIYVALEPYVRRRWPVILVSWSRVLAGDLRDPLVGRDVLAGCVLGTFGIVVARGVLVSSTWFGALPSTPYGGATREFLGARWVVSSIAGNVMGAFFQTLALLFVLFLFRLLLRREWAAGTGVVLLFTAFAAASPSPVVSALVSVVTMTASVVLLIRFGLLALLASNLIGGILSVMPLTTDVSVWYAGTSFAGLLLVAGIAFYGFYTSLGGRPMFGTAALDE